MGKALEHSSCEWKQGGHKVDVGKEGPIFKYVCTKLESEFLASQDKYFQLHEHLEF